jgi:hypothetical protein
MIQIVFIELSGYKIINDSQIAGILPAKVDIHEDFDQVVWKRLTYLGNLPRFKYLINRSEKWLQ